MSVSHPDKRRGLRLSLIEIIVVAGGLFVAGMAGIATGGLLPI